MSVTSAMSALDSYSHPVQWDASRTLPINGSNANVPNGTNGSNANGPNGTVRAKVASGMSGGRLREKQQVQIPTPLHPTTPNPQSRIIHPKP